MNYYEKNKRAALKRFPYIIKQMTALETDGGEMCSEVFWDADLHGSEILAVQREGRLWYLNSRYDSGELVEEWCQTLKRKHYFEPELIFGIGNGDYLATFRRQNPENPIFVYEPDEAVFFALMNHRDLSEILEDENLFLGVGKQGIDSIRNWMEIGINYSNYEYLVFCALPGYTSVYPYEYLLLKRTFMETIETLVLKRNTLRAEAGLIVENELSHIRDCVKQASLAELIAAFERENVKEERTAILVAAGPSLDNNIQELKAVEGKAFIMAVDTAMKPLLQAGIKPDMFITVDPVKDMFLYEQEGIEEIPMILSVNVRAGVSKLHTGKHFYTMHNGDYIDSIMKRYEKETVAVLSGGSVATDAFEILRKMKFATIILVGQDLAYPGNRTHAKAAYDRDVDSKAGEGLYFTVEDIHGEPILTRLDMNHYRRWFEDKISANPKLRVIDGTEGGAKIRGTQIMTLREAIAQECREVYDYTALIAAAGATFTEEEQKQIHLELDELPNRVEDIRRELEQGKRLFETLDKLNRKGKYQSKEFKDTYEKITAFNRWLEEDGIVDMLSCLASEREMEIQNRAYEVKEDLYEDIREIAKHGMDMVDAYCSKIPELLECMKQLDN